MVEIELTSKKFCCHFTLHEKLTIIRGDSGKGKTEFTRRISSSSANQITISNGWDIVVLTKDIFSLLVKKALSYSQGVDTTDEKAVRRYLANYWSSEDNFPLPGQSIYLIDDEDFVRSNSFAVLIECDNENYYVIINRSSLPNLSNFANEVYFFVANGRNHYLEQNIE